MKAKSQDVVQLVGIVGGSGRGELSHLLLLFLFFLSIENRVQGVSSQVAPPDEPFVGPLYVPIA